MLSPPSVPRCQQLRIDPPPPGLSFRREIYQQLARPEPPLLVVGKKLPREHPTYSLIAKQRHSPLQRLGTWWDVPGTWSLTHPHGLGLGSNPQRSQERLQPGPAARPAQWCSVTDWDRLHICTRHRLEAPVVRDVNKRHTGAQTQAPDALPGRCPSGCPSSLSGCTSSPRCPPCAHPRGPRHMPQGHLLTCPRG